MGWIAALKSRDEEMAGFTALNEKQARARRNGATESNVKMRAQFWSDLNEGRLWLRTDKTRRGFTTPPRTMALIINVIENLSKQATEPLSAPAQCAGPARRR